MRKYIKEEKKKFFSSKNFIKKIKKKIYYKKIEQNKMEAQKKIKILNLQIRDFSDENNVKPENFSIKRNGAFIGTDPVNGKDRDLI